ncbi:hypothetical protein AB0G60_30190 [Streptomyces angustmyceticus]|uniref:Uncharacterized protein n=1 Tax=Streptomyces angustmyceticus TaxID=285578 RepID=A0A5J4LC91_9ACTN|nr:hypothetical protein [Streptomyces angustmyceticus]UAL70842.1 hypothetical protein K7396_33285 [Streptomyces angustmyceticus]GES29822.1 hypothetical protein San01_23090 [Streptomyces angustmyceticus]
MNSLTGLLSQIPPGPAYAVLAAAIIAESVLLVGALVPTRGAGYTAALSVQHLSAIGGS